MAASPASPPVYRMAKEAADEGRSKSAEGKRQEREGSDVAVKKDVQGSGNIDETAVAALCRQHREEIRGCFTKEKPARLLVLTLRFQADGKIKEVVPGNQGLSGFQRCLTELFRKWTWPPTRDGRPGEVTVEINLG
jgi:hypothetical protein